MTSYLRLTDGTIIAIGSSREYSEAEWLALGDELADKLVAIDAELDALQEEPLPVGASLAVEEALANYNYDNYTYPFNRLMSERAEVVDKIEEWDAVNG